MKVIQTATLAAAVLCGACAGFRQRQTCAHECAHACGRCDKSSCASCAECSKAAGAHECADTADGFAATTPAQGGDLEYAAAGMKVSDSPALATADASPANPWKWALTPYLWLPNINGTLKYDLPSGSGGTAGIELGPNDYGKSLNFAMMVGGEVRNGKWSLFGDAIYLSVHSERSAVDDFDFGSGRVNVGASLDAGTETDLRASATTLAGGYALVDGPGPTVDVIAGFRYLRIRAETDWDLHASVTGPGGGGTFQRSGSASDSADLFDPIVGARGRFRLGDSNWSIPFYFDVGAGASNWTWQGMIGVSYSWDWGDLTLAYRELYFDQGGDRLVQDLRLGGPALAVTIRF